MVSMLFIHYVILYNYLKVIRFEEGRTGRFEENEDTRCSPSRSKVN